MTRRTLWAALILLAGCARHDPCPDIKVEACQCSVDERGIFHLSTIAQPNGHAVCIASCGTDVIEREMR